MHAQVLAFPCNAFGGQEPGSWEEIQAFAKARNISFPVFPKVEVNGDQESPVFAFLKSRLPGASGLLKVGLASATLLWALRMSITHVPGQRGCMALPCRA